MKQNSVHGDGLFNIKQSSFFSLLLKFVELHNHLVLSTKNKQIVKWSFADMNADIDHITVRPCDMLYFIPVVLTSPDVIVSV